MVIKEKAGGYSMIPVPRWVIWLMKPLEVVFSLVAVILSVKERVKKIGRRD